eukprot:1143255-Pelagomonas_calceolata.AAC.5
MSLHISWTHLLSLVGGVWHLVSGPMCEQQRQGCAHEGSAEGQGMQGGLVLRQWLSEHLGGSSTRQ